MENKEKEAKKIRFSSFFDPVAVKPEDQSSHFVHQKHLDYDEKGKVVVVDDGQFDMYQLVQSFKNRADYKNQIKELLANGQTAPGSDFGPVESLDNLNDLSARTEELKAQKAKLVEASGMDQDTLLKASQMDQETLNKFIEDKVKEMIAAKTATPEAKENTENE